MLPEPPASSQHGSPRLAPVTWMGVAALLAYSAWITGYWLVLGIDYRAMATESNLVDGIIVPLGVAAIAMALLNSWAGWWRVTLLEQPRVARPWLLVVLLVAMLGFIVAGLAQADWPGIGIRHLAILCVAMALVGFCEEMATRGILLASLRGSGHSEPLVWFWSCGLFGALHASNALFGVGAFALVQVLLAFCVGSGLYLLRRLSGTLLLPMAVHAAWDFSTFVSGMSGAALSLARVAFLFATYGLSLALAVAVLRTERADRVRAGRTQAVGPLTKRR